MLPNYLPYQEQPVLYRVKEKTVNRVIGKRIEPEHAVFINRYIYTEVGKLEIPSMFTSYIQSSFDSVNTQIQQAKFITHFLNYITIQAYENNSEFEDVKTKGLKSLNFTHAASYLRYCIEELNNSRQTCMLKQRSILRFYDYLKENEIIDIVIEKIEYLDKNNIRRQKIVSPFNQHLYKVHFPPKIGKLNKAKYMDDNVYKLFMKCCEEICPEIKLGIFLQTRAGLRAGEVVNCTIDAIHINSGNYFSSIDVLDRQLYLFGKDFDDTLKTSQVKKQRYNQPIIDLEGKLEEIYNKHLKLMTIRRKKHTPKNALFINKDGYAMTGVEYRNKFNSLKKYFLKEIQKESMSDWTYFNDRTWSSHIGRAIYTNFCIIEGLCNTSAGNPSARILALLRGDSSDKSAQAYLDEFIVNNYRKKRVNELKRDVELAISRMEVL